MGFSRLLHDLSTDLSHLLHPWLRPWRLCLAVLIAFASQAQALVILQYQDIGIANNPNSVSIANFESHLSFIEDNNLKVISLLDVQKLLNENKPLPDKTVVITFDYGNRSLLEHAWPLLKKHSFPFAIMLSPALQDSNNPQVMTWSELKILADQEVVMVNRSYSGDHLIRKLGNENNLQWQARVAGDIAKAQLRIAEKLNQNHKLLAYPYGEYSREIDNMLTRDGYVTIGSQPGPVPTYPAGSVLPRFSFGASNGNDQDFQLKVLSLPLPVAQVTVLSEGNTLLIDPELPLDVTRPILKLYMEFPIARTTVCFISGQGAGESRQSQFGVQFQAKKSLPAGARSYYNCTAPTEEPTRNFWYSQLFITRKKDGSWPAEAP